MPHVLARRVYLTAWPRRTIAPSAFVGVALEPDRERKMNLE